MRYSCYPLVVVFYILSWYRFHCRGMTQHLNAKIAKRNGTRPSALHSISIFEGSLAQLLRFDVVNLET